MNTIGPCGVDCAGCADFKVGCEGCREIQGEVSWASSLNATVCPLYDCPVNKKGLASCGECAELPCRMFFDCRDPAVSLEVHEREIRERVARLRPPGKDGQS